VKKLTFFLLVVLAGVIFLTWTSSRKLRLDGERDEYDAVGRKTAIIMERAATFLAEGRGDLAEAAYVSVITNFPSSSSAEKALRSLAEYNKGKGDLKRTVYYYSRLIEDFPDIPDLADVRKEVDSVNIKIMESSLKTEDSIEYTVVPGDSLFAIAKKFNTTTELIKKMNNLKTDVLQIGWKLKISTARFSIQVDKAKNILELKKDGRPFKTYTVATGKDNSTPVGVFQVTDKMVKPVWTKPGVGMVMPDSEEYELGARWIPISLKGYGIHGTNDESSIGGQTTAGCVRMYNNDVIELYDIIPVGTEVEIIDSARQSLPEAPEEDKDLGEADGDNT
jgi:lipoprotein-anchoring transpeptidase ErfK/SrfK